MPLPPPKDFSTLVRILLGIVKLGIIGFSNPNLPSAIGLP